MTMQHLDNTQVVDGTLGRAELMQAIVGSYQTILSILREKQIRLLQDTLATYNQKASDSATYDFLLQDGTLNIEAISSFKTRLDKYNADLSLVDKIKFDWVKASTPVVTQAPEQGGAAARP